MFCLLLIFGCLKKKVWLCFFCVSFIYLFFFYYSEVSLTNHVIREVYDSENAHETFEADLDKALYAKVNYIIIEPTRLGDETGRWITVGNCLHKTAVISGLASVASGIYFFF